MHRVIPKCVKVINGYIFPLQLQSSVVVDILVAFDFTFNFVNIFIHFYLLVAAIGNLRSPNFSVDLHNVHSNILFIHMANPKITANNFAKRLSLVTERELKDNIIVDEKEKGKQGIQLKVSSRNWPYVRIVLYNQIADRDVDYIIKKIEYVIQEYDGACKSL